MSCAEARREKPRVSAFTSANIDKILALKPDLVLTLSDLQAEIVAELIRRELTVHASNQRTLAGTLDMIRMLGAMVDAGARADELITTLEAGLAKARAWAEGLMRRPRVFFEERDDPLISGIGWVSELIEIAGGIDVFTDRRQQGQRQEQPNGSAGESMPYRDIPVSGESSRSLRPVRDVRKPSSGDLPPARERWFESIFLQR